MTAFGRELRIIERPFNNYGVARPRKFDHDSALEAAMQVFWRNGYEGTSIADLTAATGMQPGSLYAAFGGKADLFRKALERYCAGPAAFIHAALTEPTAYRVVERILRGTAEFLTQPNMPRGCMTIDSALTCGEEAAAMRGHLIELRVREQQALTRRLKRAQREGELAAGEHPATLAAFINTVFQGMTVQAINGASRHELMRVVDTALRCWPAAT